MALKSNYTPVATVAVLAGLLAITTGLLLFVSQKHKVLASGISYETSLGGYTLDGRFGAPRDFAVDNGGSDHPPLLFIADASQNRIMVTNANDSKGGYVNSFDSGLSSPRGVAVTPALPGNRPSQVATIRSRALGV